MNENGFPNDQHKAVYNWLKENGSEKVATEVTNILNSNQIADLYDGLVADGYIEEEENEND